MVLPPQPASGCAGNVPIVVASDAAAQSDIYSAVTLAGVIGTACIVLAGARDEPTAADERARLDGAAGGGFLVGGTAAVPEAKVAGRGLTRIAGADRWHTARLVGNQALSLAGGDGGDADASAGAQDPATDCAGDVPIVVASDDRAESDLYSAVTLAGVVGTDCIVLAGSRRGTMSGDQVARLEAAGAGGYVLGGLAAVSGNKLAGRDMIRLAGTDRWNTALLVGEEARRLAIGGTGSPTSLYVIIARAGAYSCGVKDDGVIDCWISDPFRIQNMTSATITEFTADTNQWCAKRHDGSTTCWSASDLADEPISLAGPTSRGQMATFLDRAFAFPDVDMMGFVDVNEDSSHSNSINRAWASGVIDECNFGERGPLIFCPEPVISRAQAATILSKAIDWREANSQLKPTGSEDSVTLTASYDEASYKATLGWVIPESKMNQVDRYIVQWREPWRAFDASRQKSVEAITDKSSYSTSMTISRHGDFYALRLVVIYGNGDILVTNETKLPSNSYQVLDLIGQEIVTPKQDSQPWLKDTWRYVNSPRFGIDASKSSGAWVSLNSEHSGLNSLEINVASGLTVSSRAATNFGKYKRTIVHELGHVYTLTNNISTNLAPRGLGHLYLAQLSSSHSGGAKKSSRCIPQELYADLAVLAFFDPDASSFRPYHGTQSGSGFSLGYWAGCGFNLSQQESDSVSEVVSDITRSVFIEQDMPDWFNDTYQSSDDSIDLESLWSNIHEEKVFIGSRKIIAHDLRNKFGGYCSEKKVRELLDKKIPELKNHWKDAGCDKPEPETEATTNSANTAIQNREARQQATYSVSYTLDYLSRARARPSKCWIAIGNYVYDVTPGDGGYDHPGPGSINQLCGQDASEHFRTNSLSPPPQEFIRGRVR